MILLYIQNAISNLLSAKLRSFLAILGVLVGTASVVALISSSELATAHAVAQFKKLGTNLLSVYMRDASQQSGSSDQKEFTENDTSTIIQASKQIVLIAPYTMGFESM